MPIHRPLLFFLVACCAWAQQPEAPGQVFRATVNVVVVPVTVTDGNGDYVHNLQPADFRLLDNEKPQDIKVDVSFVPISMVVAIQANWDTDSILPKIHKVGPLLQGTVVGEQGEIAVLAFDHRIQLLQDFTTDYDRINEAIKKTKAGSSSSRMIDAASTAVRMLSKRPQNRRRILLLISETRDRGSETHAKEAMTDAQLQNVLVYTVNINRLLTTFNSRPQAPRPDPLPPGARPMPANMPPTPQNSAQVTAGAGNSASFIPLFVEIFRQTKSIFVDNPAEVFTKYTGGSEYSFTTERGLEQAVQKIGEQLHSQYIISYTPDNKIEGGFHEIKVAIPGRRDLKVLTRPGYWMAAVPE